MRTRPVLLALLFAPAIGLAQQPDSTLLPRVVITATRSDSPLGATLSAVTVLRGDALRQAGVRDVADALKLVPGIAIARSGGPGAQTSLFLRGGESDYVRVLIDGVPMNDPGGAIDLAGLTLDNVDRIEVVRGPASVLYGTDAMTGVVQVFTREGQGRLMADAEARAGRYGERFEEASLGGSAGVVAASASSTHTETDGMLPFNNQYRSDAASGRVTVKSASGSRATFTGRVFDDRYHYPTDGAGNVVDVNARRTQRRGTAVLEAEQPLTERLSLGAAVSLLEGRGGTVDDPDDASDTTGLYAYRSFGSLRRRVADTRIRASLGPATEAIVGGEWIAETQRSTDSSNYGPEPTHFGADRSNRAVYAQLLGQTHALSYVLGARYDDNRTFGAFRTGRASVSLRIWQGGSVRASLGTAFKAPTFLETFTTVFTVGNPSLAPERSRTWELGVRQTMAGGGLTLAASWFDQGFRDMIQYTFSDPGVPNYFNVAAASARGLELEASIRILAGVRADASTTFLRTRVDDAGFDSGAGATFVRGERLLRRPPIMAAISVGVNRWARAELQSALRYVGERDDRDFSSYPANPVTLRSFTTLDLGGSYRLWSGSGTSSASVTLEARLENALGTRYEEVFNFPQPGRALSIGMRVGTR